MGKGPELKTGYSTPQYQAMGYNQGAAQRAGALAGQGLGLYDVGGGPMAPTYNVVNPEMMMPTKQWWDSLSPEVMQGIYAPYQEAGRGMMEMMGDKGQIGSARGGYSGAAGAAMGELAAKTGQGVGMQAWQMSQPAMSKYWDALQQREMFQPLANYDMAKQAWGADIKSKQMAQQAALGMYGQTVNNAASAWAPSSEAMWGRGILGAIGGAMQGYGGGGGSGGGGGYMGAIGGGMSGFGSGFYGS